MTTRREVTLGMLAAAFGATLSRGASAADSANGVNCLTIVYPAGEGLTFNADYYRDHHLKTIMKLYGSTIQRFELRTVNVPKAMYAAAVNGKTLQDDVPNFTSTSTTRLPSMPPARCTDRRSYRMCRTSRA